VAHCRCDVVLMSVELETEADKSEAAPVLSFAPSKWETVDESELEAQGETRCACCNVCHSHF